ncbi:MAG: hypothetical protein IJ282_03985 [Lachnospiraceae bacterium]|nr:hypothetical protein [Lachnospiraceae bacterium]
MNKEVIGGADGPTSVFLAADWMDWFNVLGLFVMICVLLPNIIYAIKFKGVKNKCTSKVMNILEQVGRYACMILMVFCIGMRSFGFFSLEECLIYLLGNIFLIIVYWIIWLLYFVKQKAWKSMALAILPTAIFLLSGITQRHFLLIIAATIFGVAHIYVTYKNIRD